MGSEAAVKSPYFIAPKRRNLLDSQLEDEDIFEIQASFKLFLGIPHNIDAFERTTSLVSINPFV